MFPLTPTRKAHRHERTFCESVVRLAKFDVSQQAVFKMTEAVTCTKCKHQHLLEPPSLEMSVADLESVKVSAAVA